MAYWLTQKVGDLLVRAGLLAAEVVRREAEDHEAAVLVPPVQRLEPLVLRRVAALARRIDDQQHLARVLAERLRLLEQGVHAAVEKRGAGGHGGFSYYQEQASKEEAHSA